MKLVKKAGIINKEVFRGIKIKNTKASILKVKILSIIDDEFKNYEELIKPTQESKDYDERRLSLIKKYGEMEENGELKVFENNTYRIKPDQVNSFNSDIFLLNQEFKEVLEEKIKLEEDLENWLNEEIEIPDLEINVDNLPSTLTDDEVKIIETYGKIV